MTEACRGSSSQRGQREIGTAESNSTAPRTVRREIRVILPVKGERGEDRVVGPTRFLTPQAIRAHRQCGLCQVEASEGPVARGRRDDSPIRRRWPRAREARQTRRRGSSNPIEGPAWPNQVLHDPDEYTYRIVVCRLSTGGDGPRRADAGARSVRPTTVRTVDRVAGKAEVVAAQRTRQIDGKSEPARKGRSPRVRRVGTCARQGLNPPVGQRAGCAERSRKGSASSWRRVTQLRGRGSASEV